MLNDDLGLAIQHSVDEIASSFFMEDCGVKPGPVKVITDDQPYEPPEADLTAMVGFGGNLQGGVHLSAPLHVALGLASAFMGEPVEESDEGFHDAFGELANIISGTVKSQISEEIVLTPPVIVTGNTHGIEYTGKMESTKCYFFSNKGPFLVEVFHLHQVRYTVSAFKIEHEQLVAAFKEVQAIGIDTMAGKKLFWKMEAMLVSHLTHEDTSMYPLLKKSSVTDPKLQTILDHFSVEMESIVQTVTEFSQILESEAPSSDLAETLNSIGTVLLLRIKLEEAIIYPAFERLE
jgi:chemotaxis protein CheX